MTSTLKRKAPMARVKPLSGILRTANLSGEGKPTLAAKPKMRKCKVCKTPFIVRDSMRDKWCSPDCGAALAMRLVAAKKAKAAKLDRADTRARKETIKPRAKWLAEAQIEFNRFIKARDAHLSCISCGNTREKSKYNAGHYLSVGAHPELRFNEDNVHKQCEYCNTHLSGNVSAYRPRLIAKIGAERVEMLEGHHVPAKYTIDDAKLIKDTYKDKLRELLAEGK